MPWARVSLVAASALLLATGVALAMRISAARGVFVTAGVDGDVGTIIALHRWVAAWLGCAALVCLVAVGFYPRRSARPIVFAALVGSALSLTTCGLVSLLYAERIADVFATTMRFGVSPGPENLRPALMSLRVRVLALESVFVVGVCLARILDSRQSRQGLPGRSATHREQLLSLGLLVFGMAAFLSTRGYAYDADHPSAIVVRSNPDRTMPNAALPATRACVPTPPCALVSLSAGRLIHVNGRRASTSTLEAELITSARNAAVLRVEHCVVLETGDPHPIHYAELLRAAHRSGARRIYLLVRQRYTVWTATTGTTAVDAPCAVSFSLDTEAGQPLGSIIDVADWVRRSESGLQLRAPDD